MAAPSVGRQSCAGQKESGGLDYSKPPLSGVLNGLLYDGFFSFTVVRQQSIYKFVFFVFRISLYTTLQKTA